MKKRLLIIFLLLCFSISQIPVSAANEQFACIFDKDSLKSGKLTATVLIAGYTDSVNVTLGYYSDNTLIKSSTKTLTISPNAMAARDDIAIEIPITVANGDYVKAIAYDPKTLAPCPLTSGNQTLYCTDGAITADTYYKGISERYYTIDSPDGSLCVNNRVVSVSETPTPFRLKDMCEGYFAFEDKATPKYRLEYTSADGIRVYFCSVGSTKQLWILESFNGGYAIAHANGGYLAIKDGLPVIQDEKYEWNINFYGESPFSLMTSLEGFRLFSDDEKQRIIDICTSIGADAFPFAANNLSFIDDCEKVFNTLYYGSFTPEEEKAKILEAVSKPILGNLVNPYYALPTYPGGDAVITQSSPVKTKHVMWDLVEENGIIYSASDEHPYTGAPINCYRIDVTYTTAENTHNVALYCVDPDFANVQTAITALSKIPYAYRQFIKTMYVYLSTTTSTYNCGGEELFVRLNSTADEQSMIKGFVHELGHSCDYMANGNTNDRASHWNQGAKWQEAVTNDIATISGYGNSNSDEGFAEFARIYWLSYSNRDLEIGLSQLYPNRFASFQRMLTKIGCTDMVY